MRLIPQDKLTPRFKDVKLLFCFRYAANAATPIPMKFPCCNYKLRIYLPVMDRSYSHLNPIWSLSCYFQVLLRFFLHHQLQIYCTVMQRFRPKRIEKYLRGTFKFKSSIDVSFGNSSKRSCISLLNIPW